MSLSDFIKEIFSTKTVSKAEADPEKKELELQKLRNDVEFSKLQLKNYSRTQWFEFIKIVISLGTIIGLFLTFFNQQKQLQLAQKQHYDDALAKDIQQLAVSTNESSKIVALSKLSTYFSKGDSGIDQQLINLFLQYAELDTLEGVRSFIQTELFNKVPGKLLPILIKENIQIANGYRSGVLEDLATTRKRNNQLRNNTDWIINCMKQMRIVENIDCSNIMFLSKDTIISRSNNHGIILALPDIYIEKVNFKNVSFKNSDIRSVGFISDTFSHVSFDESIITNVAFERSEFLDCSFKGFEWFDYYPTFQDCDLKLTNFYPYCYDTVKVPFFTRCKWNIDSIESMKCYSYTAHGSSDDNAQQIVEK